MANLALIIAANTVPIILATKPRYQNITGILDQVCYLINMNFTDIILIKFRNASMHITRMTYVKISNRIFNLCLMLY